MAELPTLAASNKLDRLSFRNDSLDRELDRETEKGLSVDITDPPSDCCDDAPEM